MTNETTETTQPTANWIDVELPSGETVKIRRMKSKDEDILTDIDLARSGGTTDALLASCTDRTMEQVTEMLLGDRTFLLIEIRKLRSHEYSPSAQCPTCGTTGEQDIDLRTLRLQKLNVEKLGPGGTFTVHLPVEDIDVTCALLTGKEEKQLAKLKRDYPKQLSTYQTMARVKEVPGIPIKKFAWFEDLDGEDTQAIRDAFEEYDCGYDTEVGMKCTSCGTEWRQELPFDQTFFRGRRKKKPR